MSAIKHDASLYKIVVIHYLIAAICFLVLAVMMLFSVDAFSGHYFQPKILAMTHMAVLGWGTLIIWGACYQLLPVVLETELFSKKLAWISLSLFLPGLIALVYSFWVFDPGIHMECGSILLLASILLFTINVFFTARKKQQGSIHHDFIFTSSLCLAFTALLGTALVFNFQFAFLPQDQLHFLRLHAHIGIVGWFLLLVIGVSTKLVPMFLVSSYHNTRLLSWSYYLIVAALLLFLVDAYIWGINYKTYFIVLIGSAGIACYLVFIGKCYKSRIRKTIDLPMMHTFFSLMLLTIAIIILPLIIMYNLKHDPASVRYSLFYGSMLFMGWLTALILGQTFKTLPFIVWIKHYEHLTGKVQTPMPADLVQNNTLKIQAVAFVVFCITFFGGCFFSSGLLKYIGISALLISAVTYLVNVIHVLLHQTKTTTYDKV